MVHPPVASSHPDRSQAAKSQPFPFSSATIPQRGGCGDRTLDTSRLYGSKTSYLLIHFLIKCINTHPPYRRCDSESSPANLSNAEADEPAEGVEAVEAAAADDAEAAEAAEAVEPVEPVDAVAAVEAVEAAEDAEAVEANPLPIGSKNPYS